MMDRHHAMIVALELQRDVELMASNLTVLNQYAMVLHHMSLEVLQSVLGQDEFPTQAVEDAAPVPCVYNASIQMAAMGPWRPPCGPGGPGPATVDHDGDCPG